MNDSTRRRPLESGLDEDPPEKIRHESQDERDVWLEHHHPNVDEHPRCIRVCVCFFVEDL